MRTAVVPDAGDGGWIQDLDATGAPARPPRHLPHLRQYLADVESRTAAPRWIVSETRRVYPAMLAAGLRLTRTWDVTLSEAVLLGAEGRGGEPPHVDAAYARLRNLPVPPPPDLAPAARNTLFDTVPASDPKTELDTLVAVYRGQLRRTDDLPGSLKLLLAAESAGGLIAAEMTHHGLPWRRDIHDAILTDLIGPRPVKGMRPKRLQQLADEVADRFGHPVNPDSPQQVIAAFRRAGHPVDSTRAWELSEVAHPAVRPLLRYKELARIHSAHGWKWMSEWVTGDPDVGGRFRPEYVVGGVVTGRWATKGGGALQIPRALRPACHADPGWKLVVADASQLEPRVLAAMSGDHAMASAAGTDDLYAALAPTFGGHRDDAKIALLSAMYGGTAGNANRLLTVMRRRFPQAWNHVEAAARVGETGGTVKTWLGRTCPPPPEKWWIMRSRDTRAVRDRGRFTRNFVVQGTAAEWALAMMGYLRGRLHADHLGDLVFFQHDEVIVHSPVQHTDEVAHVVQQSADDATRLLFGDTNVRIPLTTHVVDHYGQAGQDPHPERLTSS